MKKMPNEVAQWVRAHKGWRTPRHDAGMFESYSTSRASCCWGQPIGGITTGNYKVAACQPSPRKSGDLGAFLFDYIKIA